MQGQKSPERSAQPGVYVGVDVCKDWLDVYLHPVGQKFRVPNTAEGLKTLKRRIAKMPVALIVMEATAKFHRQAHRTLHAAGLAVAVVNPLRARLFAEAVGQLAKTDRLDARVLALMGQALEPSAIAPRARSHRGVAGIGARAAAKANQTALSNQRGDRRADRGRAPFSYAMVCFQWLARRYSAAAGPRGGLARRRTPVHEGLSHLPP